MGWFEHHSQTLRPTATALNEAHTVNMHACRRVSAHPYRHSLSSLRSCCYQALADFGPAQNQGATFLEKWMVLLVLVVGSQRSTSLVPRLQSTFDIRGLAIILTSDDGRAPLDFEPIRWRAVVFYLDVFSEVPGGLSTFLQIYVCRSRSERRLPEFHPDVVHVRPFSEPCRFWGGEVRAILPRGPRGPPGPPGPPRPPGPRSLRGVRGPRSPMPGQHVDHEEDGENGDEGGDDPSDALNAVLAYRDELAGDEDGDDADLHEDFRAMLGRPFT
jgi:hypothetical protein